MEAKRIVMSSRLTIWAAVAIATMLGGRVVAQGVVMERNLSLAMAKTIAEAALAECRSKGYHTSAAVVDRAGHVLVIMRDEQATAQTAEMAWTQGVPRACFGSARRSFRNARRTIRRGRLSAISPISSPSAAACVQVGNDDRSRRQRRINA